MHKFPTLARLMLLACVAGPVTGQPSEAEVWLVHNAVIHTADSALPAASAMAWGADGRLLTVGGDSAVLTAHPGAEIRDLGGRTVIPGLIDTHAHLSGYALSLTQANLMGTGSQQEIFERLRQHAAGLGPEDWLLGRGWDQNDWADTQLPTRADLDAYFPDRPVWLRRVDGHAGWANSAALALTDRSLAGDWQPAGGYIHRDASGQATGVLVDGAMDLVSSLAPSPSRAVMETALRQAIADLLRQGLTGVHDAGVGPDTIGLYRQLIERGVFATRVYAMVSGSAESVSWLCAHGAIDDASGRLVVRSVKLYEDGALGSRGAALLDEYTDDPGNRGLLFFTTDALAERMSQVMGCGLQVAVHAIGDHANRVALDALERSISRHPGNPGRHRVEHAQILHEDDLGRFAQLSVIAAMQPTHATSDMYWAGERLGQARLRYAYAWRSLLDSGARLALGSDFPVEAVNPMLGIHAAVTRQDNQGWPAGGWQPQERLTRAEALRGFTLDAAWSGFMEDDVGSLTPGKRADFVVLDRDIMQVPAAEIAETVVLETWLDGRRAYPAPAD